MISDEEQRIFFVANALTTPVVNDITNSLNNFRDGVETLTFTTDDFLYIGQYLPFAAKYVDIPTANINTSVISKIEYWTGTEWEEAIDIRDETVVSGKSMAQSGYIKFKPDWDLAGWGIDDTDEIDNLKEDANVPRIRCMYWARISWTANLSALDLNYVGQLFSNDDEMYSSYPGLNNQNLRDTYEQGSPAGTKLDWIEQGFMAAELIVRDMKTRNFIISEGQIIDTDLLSLPSQHKQAQIIFGGLERKDPKDEAIAMNRYKKYMELSRLNIDRNGSGDLSRAEKSIRTGFATL